MQLPIQLFVRLSLLLRRKGVKYLKAYKSFWCRVDTIIEKKKMVAILSKFTDSCLFILLFILLN